MMYQKMKNSVLPPPLYKCIVVLLAAAAFILTACSGLQEDGGEKNIRINLPPIVSASGNSRALSGDRLPTLKTETRKYRVTVNGITREGTGSSYEFRLAVGIRATAIIECLNSSGEVIIRAVKDFTVSGGENSIDINLKNDGTEIIPSAPQPVPNQVTYSYGEADRHGNKNGIPSDPKTYSEGDVFEVKAGSGMTWDHATQQSGFLGWKTNVALVGDTDSSTADVQANGNVQVGGKYKMPRGGVTLTAQWNKKSYTITYDMNASGSGRTQTSTSINQGSVQALEDYTIDGTTPASVSAGGKNYTFMEWSDGNGNTYAVGRKITNVTGNITLTAQWSDKNVWTVTYNKGSTQADTQDITNWIDSDNAEDGNSVMLPTLQAAGYTFTGWQIDGEASNKTGSYTPTASVTATAQWTPITYTITYNADGGNVNPSSDTFDVTTGTINFPQANGKTGYSFDYWKTADGTNVTGMGGEQLAALVPSGSTTLALTAVWREETYNIEYTVANGEGTGTVSASFTITQNGGQVTLNDGTAGFTRGGYRIASWKYADNSTAGNAGAQVAASALIAKVASGSTSLQLTAVWTPIQYTITYNANGGGTNPASTTFTVEGGTVTLDTGSSLSNSGHGFAGWSTQQNGTAITDTSASALIGLMSGSNTSITLYAVWKTGFDVIDSTGTTTNYDDFTAAWNSANGTTATLKLYQDASSVGVTLTGGNVTLDLNGKTLTGNDSTTAGSPVITIGASSSQEMCTLTLKGDGRITRGNSPSIGGGGVYIYPNGKFIMQGGSLYFNTASAPRGFGVNGGGVYNAGTFVMEGGEITMCMADNSGNGGGIYVAANAKFTKNGGTVSGNTIDSGRGSQLFVAQNGTYNINGTDITVSAAEGFALDDAF